MSAVRIARAIRAGQRAALFGAGPIRASSTLVFATALDRRWPGSGAGQSGLARRFAVSNLPADRIDVDAGRGVADDLDADAVQRQHRVAGDGSGHRVPGILG